MEDKLIWNKSKTMCFMASAFNGAGIDGPSTFESGTPHRVRVYLRGSFRRAGKYQGSAGLLYDCCDDEESAKKSLEELVTKLRCVGLEEEPDEAL